MFRRHVSLIGVMLLVAGLAAPASAAEPASSGRQARDLAARERQGIIGPSRVIPQLATPRGAARVEPGPNTVGVTSSVAYEWEGLAVVIAEVKNNTAQRRQFIEIEAQFHDAAGKPVGEPMLGGIWAYELAYGASSPAFAIGEFVPPTATSVNVVATRGDIVQQPAVGALTVTSPTVQVGSGIRTYTATIRNPNDFAVQEAYLAATTYDAARDVIDANATFDTVSIPARGEVSVAVELREDPEHPTAGVSFLADGFRSIAFGTYVTSWNNYFDDLGNSSFRKDVEWLAANRITAGCAPGRYCPTANVRRDEMASFLSRALGLTGTPANAFVDDNGNTHELSINRIKAAGITSGCNPAQQLYCPENSVRRDEMASFLSRALELTGTPANAFSDDNGNTHELHINRLAAAGVTSGCGPSTYCPAQNVTRGQMAAFLRRAFEE